MRNLWLMMAALLVSMPASAQTVAAPALHESDTWVYQSTSETKAGWHQTRVEITVLRVGASSMSVSVRPVGSTSPRRRC